MVIQTIQKKGQNYKVFDKVITANGTSAVPVTQYLCTDEKGNVVLIYPHEIEVINP
jgi:hypothetical protein